MGWTSARTWVNGELVTATLMNTHVKDNLAYLFSGRAGQTIVRDNDAIYTTSSTNWVDVDSTNLSITLTPQSGKVWITFSASVWMAASACCAFDITVDGTRIGAAGASGLAICEGTLMRSVALCVPVTGLSVEAHTFRVQWKVFSSTAYMSAGDAGMNTTDALPSFAVLEVG